ncbi:MAG: hypothetical protein PVH74_14020 [Desulfobacterales bacterium]
MTDSLIQSEHIFDIRYNRIAVLPEEVYLESKFGDRYTAYKMRVRRWI